MSALESSASASGKMAHVFLKQPCVQALPCVSSLAASTTNRYGTMHGDTMHLCALALNLL
jgi:hypothetical protein